jgi:antitoxin (DNA-binding transcriptional repressor) of toxin-antitoxin stability system
MINHDGLMITGLNDLHYRWLEVRDHLLKGDTLLLTRRGKPLALIKPLSPDDKPPREALVRSVTYIKRNKRDFVFKLLDGEKMVLTYRGKKIGLVNPRIPKKILSRYT